MKIDSFTEIIAWQKARELTRFVYQALRENKDFGFRDQIQRASISVMNNIAEGFERRSNAELKHFLFIAKGSVAEVRSMLIIGTDLGYFTDNQFQEFDLLGEDIAKLLSGFIKKL